jgi:hypothetical protein
VEVIALEPVAFDLKPEELSGDAGSGFMENETVRITSTSLEPLEEGILQPDMVGQPDLLVSPLTLVGMVPTLPGIPEAESRAGDSSQTEKPSIVPSVGNGQKRTATLEREVPTYDPDTRPAGLGLSLAGGADEVLFATNARTGQARTGLLNFIAPRDFAHPQDDGGAHVPEVVIHVSDGETIDRPTGYGPVTDVHAGRSPGEVNGDGRVDRKDRGAAFPFLFSGQKGTDTTPFPEKKEKGVSDHVDLRTWLVNEWLVHRT